MSRSPKTEPTENADRQIANMVRLMSEAPIGDGQSMWHSIASHLYNHGYRRRGIRTTATSVNNEAAGRVSTGRAAELLGVTSQTVREYIRTGRIAGYRVGPRNYSIPMSEIERFLEVSRG